MLSDWLIHVRTVHIETAATNTLTQHQKEYGKGVCQDIFNRLFFTLLIQYVMVW